MAGEDDQNINNQPPNPPPPTQQALSHCHMWKMETLLAHTDYPVCEVIQNGNGPVSISTYTQGQIKILPPKSAEEILAREKERKARTTLLMALPEDHLARFHNISDAKEMWDAIKPNAKNTGVDKLEEGKSRSCFVGIQLQTVPVIEMSARDKGCIGRLCARGMMQVPPTYDSGIYTLYGLIKEIDDSQFTYGPKQSKPSESDARSSDFNSCKSNCSEETHESMPEPVVNKPKVVSQPKVWSDAPIIEEYESDSEYEHVSLPTKEQEILFGFINMYKHV
ncbi:hypothetical protein Tco_0196512 [Tanacetum coccineum]